MIKSKIGKAAKTTAHQRTRYQKFLRKTIRRKPCSYILLINAIVLCVLIAATGGTIYFITRSQTKLAQYDNEEKIIERRMSEITFQYCPYEEEPSPFYTDPYCVDNCGTSAFAWRERKLKPGANESCLDWREQVNCHEEKVCLPHRSKIMTECAGVYHQPISADVANVKVVAPAITNENLKQYLHTSVLANQLVVHCPRCEAQTNAFRFKGDDQASHCYQKLSTRETGWPSDFQFCDLFEKVTPSSSSTNTACTQVNATNPLPPDEHNL